MDTSDILDTTPTQMDALVRQASAAQSWLEARGRMGRRDLLQRVADALEARTDELVLVADSETFLGESRLRAEVGRTTGQLRFQGEVAIDGSYLDASIDHEAMAPAGRRPDLRRTAVPVGPVAVFGASNFPLAFGVLGGDTASALAAGCPVVAKGHPSHPRTSALIGAAVAQALAELGAPDGVFAQVSGFDAGLALIDAPGIKAAGFTGSVRGGQALAQRAAARPEPIPFHGELGSLNPLVVTPAAAAADPSGIGAGIADSFTLSLGQYCTKPGVILLPTGRAGDDVRHALVGRAAGVGHGRMLNEQMEGSFGVALQQIGVDAGTSWALGTEAPTGRVSPHLAETTAQHLLTRHPEVLVEEHFGPFALVVRWSELDELARVLELLPCALTGTLHSVPDDPHLEPIARMLLPRSGRIIHNGYPTGVAVAWSQHHGGPFPATTTPFSSVGGAAIRRWVRPVCFQDAPPATLPDELRDRPVDPIVRRVDGVLEVVAAR